MKSNNVSRRSASGLTTGIAMGVGGMATLAAAQTAPGFTAVEGLVAPANVGQALTIQTATGPITVPASAYVVQNGVVLVNASTIATIQAAGGLVGGLGVSTAVASSTLAAVGGAGFVVLDTPEADPEPEPDPEPQPDPDTPGSISDGTTTVDLGIGFTVDQTTEDELFRPYSTFTVIGSSGDDTIGSTDDRDTDVGAYIGANDEDFDAGNPNKVSIDLSAGGTNNVTFGRNPAQNKGEIEITGGADDDELAFGVNAAKSSGSIAIDLSRGGTNKVTFGEKASNDSGTLPTGPPLQAGKIRITGGTGKDNVTFGDSAAFGFELPEPNYGDVAVRDKSIDIDLSHGGENTVNFGRSAAVYTGFISITGGDDKDTLTFGPQAAVDYGVIQIASGGGDDTLTFATNAGSYNGILDITGGSGNDDLDFAAYASSSSGTIVIDLSDGGANDVSFGNEASKSNGSITITGGNSDETISFGGSAAKTSGVINIDLSLGGNNSVEFGENAGTSSGSIKITGGGGNDTLIFHNNTENVAISNFGDGGVDTIYWVTDNSAPIASESSGNLNLTGIGFNISLMEITSVNINTGSLATADGDVSAFVITA